MAYDNNNLLTTQGSGVVINDKGYVVTNYHVLAGNDRIEIIH
jgi:S1-C subfamily serine protease